MVALLPFTDRPAATIDGVDLVLSALPRPHPLETLPASEAVEPTGSILTGHRIMGISFLYTGHIAESLPHLEQTLALYNPAEHRALAIRFGQDARAHTLCYRSLASWFLGHPKAALADADHAVNDAHEIGQAGTLMNALALTSFTYILCGNYAVVGARTDNLSLWQTIRMQCTGRLLERGCKVGFAHAN
jgi:predicted ATPase